MTTKKFVAKDESGSEYNVEQIDDVDDEPTFGNESGSPQAIRTYRTEDGERITVSEAGQGVIKNVYKNGKPVVLKSPMFKPVK